MSARDEFVMIVFCCCCWLLFKKQHDLRENKWKYKNILYTYYIEFRDKERERWLFCEWFGTDNLARAQVLLVVVIVTGRIRVARCVRAVVAYARQYPSHDHIRPLLFSQRLLALFLLIILLLLVSIGFRQSRIQLVRGRWFLRQFVWFEQSSGCARCRCSCCRLWTTLKHASTFNMLGLESSII